MVKLYQTWLVGLFAMLCALSAQAVSPFDPLTTAVSFKRGAVEPSDAFGVVRG